MKKAQHMVVLSVIGLALLLAAGSAMAHKDRGMHGMQQGQGMQQGYGQRMPRGYGQGGYGQQMSPEQIQQMRQVQAKYADKMYDLRGKLFAKQQELAAAMTGDEVDKGKVRSLTQEINDLRGKLFKQRTEMQLEMRKQGFRPAYGVYGIGPGMMGPGMRRGYGMGPGMMYGPGMGPGWCGMYGYHHWKD